MSDKTEKRPEGKYRYLAKNMGLLTLSSFATKILSFFLVPLYTSVLTTEQYGTYDLFSTTVGVLVPILTLNVQEAVLRFAIDKDYDRGALVTVGIRYMLAATGIVVAGLVAMLGTGLFPLGISYAVYFLLMFLAYALSGFVSFYARGIDRIRELSISSVIASVVTIALNIIFLLPLQMGLDGYFLANVIGPLVQTLYLGVVARVPRDTHLLKRYSAEEREMTRYSAPMIANSIGWWINSFSDRYIVIFFCGVAANGVYSVASKIPAILSVFTTIFNQAWTLSSIKEFDPADRDGFFAHTYAAYNCLMTLLCSVIILLDKPLARFLYANDFYDAWQYVPWLCIAIVFGATTGLLGGFFAAVKDTGEFARTTMAGAVVNVVLNFATVPLIGPHGAAVSTMVSSIVVWALRLWDSRRYVRLRINLKRDIASYVLLGAQSLVLLLVADPAVMYGAMAAFLLVISVLYAGDIRRIAKKAHGTIRR